MASIGSYLFVQTGHAPVCLASDKRNHLHLYRGGDDREATERVIKFKRHFNW